MGRTEGERWQWAQVVCMKRCRFWCLPSEVRGSASSRDDIHRTLVTHTRAQRHTPIAFVRSTVTSCCNQMMMSARHMAY